jgi:uncharacterized membrane protein YtjA (UPF0391 family)
MGPWLLLLVLALVAAVIGFTSAAYWLFVVAIVLLVAGVIMALTGRASRL